MLRLRRLWNTVGERCVIWMVPTDGGPEREVTERGPELRPDLAWSPDGRWLAFSDEIEPGGRSAIWLYQLEEGRRRRLTSPPGDIENDYSPAFSPDGRSVAFVRRAGGENRDLFVTSIDGDGPPRRLTRDRSLIVGVDWEPVPRAGA